MSTTTVNVAFQSTLLQEIDKAAQAESRSRSELLREAARAYIRRKKRWNDIFAMGRKIAKSQGISADDVLQEIAAHRKSKASRR